MAYKKPTKMSTISYNNATKFGPMNAVDGNRNSDIKFQSCAATRQEVHAWWQVDLEAVYLITDVVITNRRGECCGELEGVVDLLMEDWSYWYTANIWKGTVFTNNTIMTAIKQFLRFN